MVMLAEPLLRALAAIRADRGDDFAVIPQLHGNDRIVRWRRRDGARDPDLLIANTDERQLGESNADVRSVGAQSLNVSAVARPWPASKLR